METSFWLVQLNVPLSWPGKRGYREGAAAARVSVAEATLQRVRLTLLGDVERAYLDLRLVRGQLALQGRLESLWQQAEEIARAATRWARCRSPTCSGPSSNERGCAFQRLGLEATERSALHEVNRLRVHPLDEAVDTPVPLTEIRAGALPAAELLCRRRPGAEPRSGPGHPGRHRRRSAGEGRLPRPMARPLGHRGDHAPRPARTHVGGERGASPFPSTGGTRARARWRRPSRCAPRSSRASRPSGNCWPCAPGSATRPWPRCLRRWRSTATGSWSSRTPRFAPRSFSTGWARCPSPRCWR
jgi:hypothetical protein